MNLNSLHHYASKPTGRFCPCSTRRPILRPSVLTLQPPSRTRYRIAYSIFFLAIINPVFDQHGDCGASDTGQAAYKSDNDLHKRPRLSRVYRYRHRPAEPREYRRCYATRPRHVIHFDCQTSIHSQGREICDSVSGLRPNSRGMPHIPRAAHTT